MKSGGDLKLPLISPVLAFAVLTCFFSNLFTVHHFVEETQDTLPTGVPDLGLTKNRIDMAMEMAKRKKLVRAIMFNEAGQALMETNL